MCAVIMFRLNQVVRADLFIIGFVFLTLIVVMICFPVIIGA